jgi:hypothetical protein
MRISAAGATGSALAPVADGDLNLVSFLSACRV